MNNVTNTAYRFGQIVYTEHRIGYSNSGPTIMEIIQAMFIQ